MIAKLATAGTLLLALASLATATELERYFGKSIVSISLPESSTVDSSLIFNSAGLVTGETLTAGKLQDAIKKIYALGLFSNVVVEGEEAPGGVRLVINVQTYPRVSKVIFQGNQEIKDKNLRKELTITEGRIVSPGAIKSNVEKIKNLYEDKGYLSATVESQVVPDEREPHSAELVFKIDEGRKVKVREIAFYGNKHLDDGKLRSKMSTKVKSLFRSGTFDRDKYREDKEKIIDYYKKEGFIDALIVADSVVFGDFKAMRYSAFAGTTYVAQPDLFIRVYLDEGSRYYFGKFTWEGNSIFGDDRVSSVFDVKEGGTYDEEKYKDMLAKLYVLYQDEGYWYTQVDEKKMPRDHTMDVHLGITENQPAHVRMIYIEGNTKTKDKVIRRELMLKPDMIFKRSLLGRSLRDVMILNFFTSVTPDLKVLPDGDMDLVLKIEEKPTGSFNIGAGYSARDKLVGTFGIGWPNFLGGGQTLSLDSDLGKQRTTFSASYYEPWLLDTPTSLAISLYYQEQDWYNWFTEGRRGGSVRVGRRLRWPDNYFRIYSSYRLEELKYFDISQVYKDENETNPYSVDKTSWPKRSSTLMVSLERDSRDLAQFPTKGSVLYWTPELGGTFLGGDWDYWKQTFGADFYYTPLWKFTFALKGKWGIMNGIHRGDNDIPYSERFTPGGTDTDGIIRGYEDSRIGPTTPAGGFIGGRSMVVYNFEVSLPVVEQQLYALLFADAGNAYLTGDELRDNLYRNFYKSVGFGFRVVAPMIGIIGFDFGIPFNGPEEDQGKIRPHFQIGRGF